MTPRPNIAFFCAPGKGLDEGGTKKVTVIRLVRGTTGIHYRRNSSAILVACHVVIFGEHHSVRITTGSVAVLDDRSDFVHVSLAVVCVKVSYTLKTPMLTCYNKLIDSEEVEEGVSPLRSESSTTSCSLLGIRRRSLKKNQRQ